MKRNPECSRLFDQIPPQTQLYYLPQFNEQQMPKGDNAHWFFTAEGAASFGAEQTVQEMFDLDTRRLQQVSAGEMQKICNPRHVYILIRSFEDIRNFLCEIEVFKQLYLHRQYS